MKLFGEYLVEKKIISNDLLVQALIEQFKHLPSVAEVVFEKKLYSTDELLTIFRLQIENKISFVESAVQLKLWNAEISAKVEEHLTALRVPLGQVLVQCGSIPLEKITHALDDFFSEVNLPNSIKQKETKNEVQITSNDPFCDLLTPSLRSKLEALISTEVGGLLDSKSIDQIIIEVRRLKGAARLVNAETAEKLLSSLENLLKAALGTELTLIKSEVSEKLRGIYKNALEILWKGALEEATNGSSNEVNFEKEFQAADNQMQLMSFDLGFMDQKKGV